MKKNIFRILFVVTVSLIIAGCQCNNSEEKVQIPEVDKDSLPKVEVKIKRYEKALFSIDTKHLQEGLKKIKPEYPILLDGDLDDPQNIGQIKAYLEYQPIQDLYKATCKEFPDLAWLEKELSASFSLYSYWFPEKKVPIVYTYVSGGDFEAPVKNADSALIIALDMYLGKDYPFYAKVGMPLYKAKYLDKSYITRDCMEEIGIYACSTNNDDADFLTQMINMGKLMYFLDVTMPQSPDSIKMKYSGESLDWCKKNEGKIWSFFIDNKILYSKNKNDFLKFFADGPFTNSFGKNSPPRIAIWIGWRIVREYMRENPDTDFRTFLKETDAQKILRESKYKPKK